MDNESIIRQTENYAKEKLSGEGSGHDWWHVYRVWKTALHIAEHEKADLFVVQLAALLHDIADWKFNSGDDSVGPKLAKEWLEKLNVDSKIISHVCDIIQNMSFKGAGVKSLMKTKEGMIVQDADRLDAIGAIGIGRAFAYGGHAGREMYNPNEKPVMHQTFEQYKSAKGTTVNHFYEKLFLLKDLMNTKTAKRMAEGRHVFMEQFLDEFYKEWEGSAESVQRPKIGVGVFVIKDGKILMHKRKNAHGDGTWSLPGGHLEWNETVEECAKREVLEESGIEIKNLRHAGFTSGDFFPKEGKHYVTLYIVADYDSGEVRDMEPDKSEKWSWFEWGSIPKPLFLPMENFLKSGYNPFR